MSQTLHADLMRLLKNMENPYLHHIDLHLSRVENLMAALGRPDEDVPPVIHVAGTNGKGSLMAYLRAMVEAAGKSAHVYTSPHLVRFNERIVLNGKEVEDAELYAALQKVHRLREQYPTTLFEGVTAAAFLLFAKKPADVLLLEVGMGGRLDATNVIAKPLASVITPISLDHMEFLGESVAAIAKEKAGIIKPGVVCVVGPQAQEAMQVIIEKAQSVQAPLFRHGYEWHLREEGGKYRYESPSLTCEIPIPSLHGEHQWANAATAIAVMDALSASLTIGTDAMQQGITRAVWPARLQRLTSAHWLNKLPAGSELWLDGGHNPAAGKILAAWIREKWGEETQVHLICGMVRSKDIRGFLNPLIPHASQVVAVPIHDEPRAITPGELQQMAAELGGDAITAHSVAEALEQIAATSAPPVRVLIAGSLYLAGTVLVEGL